MSKIAVLIGENISRIRKNLKLTQEDLGNKIGAARGTITNYERGAGGINLETLNKIAIALNCDELELISPPENSELFGQIGKLTMNIDRLKNHPILVAYEKAVPDLQYAVRDLLSLEKNVSSVETDLRKSESPKKRRDSQ